MYMYTVCNKMCREIFVDHTNVTYSACVRYREVTVQLIMKQKQTFSISHAPAIVAGSFTCTWLYIFSTYSENYHLFCVQIYIIQFCPGAWLKSVQCAPYSLCKEESSRCGKVPK